jgi:hypothetical protein
MADVLADRLPTVAARHRQRADLPRRVDLERLPQPADHLRAARGHHKSLGQYAADFGGMFALMFLATLPILVFYLLLQKQFVKGLTGGATKG